MFDIVKLDVAVANYTISNNETIVTYYKLLNNFNSY